MWFPDGLVAPERFAGSPTLRVEYIQEPINILVTNRQLLVRQAGDLVLFVSQTGLGFAQPPGVDFKLRVGELACPFTAEACSEARSHTLVEAGEKTITDPCGAAIGGFRVSSLAHEARGNLCGTAVCDVFSSYYAAGVRAE